MKVIFVTAFAMGCTCLFSQEQNGRQNDASPPVQPAFEQVEPFEEFETAPAQLSLEASADSPKSDFADNEIMNIRLTIKTMGPAPKIITTPNELGVRSPMTAKAIEFNSSCFLYRRLLFEEPLLERHGLTKSKLAQPLVSGFHFFGTATVLPLELIKGSQFKCDSSPGWGNPGSPLPNYER